MAGECAGTDQPGRDALDLIYIYIYVYIYMYVFVHTCMRDVGILPISIHTYTYILTYTEYSKETAPIFMQPVYLLQPDVAKVAGV